MNKLLLGLILMVITSACGNHKIPAKNVYCSDREGNVTLSVEDARLIQLWERDRYIKIVTKDGRTIVHYILSGETCVTGTAKPPEPNKFRSKVYLENNN